MIVNWIPINEKIPELLEEVLITTKEYEVLKACYTNYGCFDTELGWIKSKDVLAWMPLPERYKEEEEEE